MLMILDIIGSGDGLFCLFDVKTLPEPVMTHYELDT